MFTMHAGFIIPPHTHTLEEFAVMLLAKVSPEQVREWVGTNRGAFVVCR